MTLLGIYRSVHHPRPLTARVWVRQISSIDVGNLFATSFLKRAVKRVVEDVAERQHAHEVAALVDHDEAVHA